MMRIKITFCSAILLFFIVPVFSQSAQTNKIKAILIQVDTLTPAFSQSEKALKMLEKAYALSLSKNCRCDSLIIELCIRLDDQLAYWGKKHEVYLKKAVGIAQRNKDAKALAGIYCSYGNIEFGLGSGKTLYYYQKALQAAQSLDNPFYLAAVYTEMGIVYNAFDQKQNARACLFKALRIAGKIPRHSEEMLNEFDTHTIKPYIFLYLSMAVESPEASYNYARNAYKTVERLDKNNSETLKKMILFQLTQLDINFKHYNEALKHNGLLLAYTKNENDGFYRFTANLNFVNIYKKKGDYLAAGKYVKVIEDDPDSLTRDRILYQMENCYRLLAAVHKENGNLKKSNQYLNKEIIRLDSLSAAKKEQIHEGFAAKYEAGQKRNQIISQKLIIKEQQTFRNNFIFLSVLGFLLVIGIAILSINAQKHKKRLVDMALEKEKEFNTYRTRFLEDITHEIRTPLTLLNGYLSLAGESIGNSAKCLSNLEKAMQSSTSVLENANELLGLSKTGIRRIKVKNTILPIEPFIKRIFFSFEAAAIVKNIRLAYSSTILNTITVYTDGNKVEKILNNLIGNAIKYSPLNAEISLSAVLADQWLTVTIMDEGPGIPENEKARIFSRFYRSTSTSGSEGLGIGLSLSAELALLLGGTIIVKNNEKKGSLFTFKIPVGMTKEVRSAQTDETGSNAEPVAQTLHETEKPLMLIVEDNQEMNRYYEEILSGDYQCYFAFDGYQGLKLAQRTQFDMVISDIMMPKMDGFTFKNLLNLIPGNLNTPFIFISAKAFTNDKIRGFDIGIDDYITKPFDKTELIARLRNLRRMVGARRKWLAENPGIILPPHEYAEKKALSKLQAIILENLIESDIKASDLALKMAFSQRNLSSYVYGLTGLSLVQFILEVRLMEAYRLIQDKEYKTINEVRYQVGISSISYFNRKFKHRFGVSPSTLLKH